MNTFTRNGINLEFFHNSHIDSVLNVNVQSGNDRFLLSNFIRACGNKTTNSNNKNDVNVINSQISLDIERAQWPNICSYL